MSASMFINCEQCLAALTKAIAKGEAAETERKLAQMRVLEREGRDVFHTLRGKPLTNWLNECSPLGPKMVNPSLMSE